MRKADKNFFDIDITELRAEGSEYRTMQASQDLQERYQRFYEQLQKVQEKAAVPCLVEIISFIAFLLWMCDLAGTLRSWADGTSLQQMYRNAPGLFYMGIGAFVVWLAIKIYKGYKIRKAMENVDVDSVKRQADALDQLLRMEFGIPQDAGFVDVLYQEYELKNGKKKVVHAMMYPYRNSELYVYRKNDMLCFCDRTWEYGIPLEKIGEAELIKMAVQVSGWNKDEPMDDPKYKEFKPYETQAGIFVKQHYAIHVKGSRENMVIRIPNYDFATVQRLLDKKTENT